MLLALEAPIDINPAVPMPGIWAVLGFALMFFAAILVLTTFTLRWLMQYRNETPEPSRLEQLRVEYLWRLDTIEYQWRHQELPAADTVRRISAEAKKFTGTVLDRDIDYLPQDELERAALREPRIGELVTLLASVQDLSFGRHQAEFLLPEEVCALFARFRQVIVSW